MPFVRPAGGAVGLSGAPFAPTASGGHGAQERSGGCNRLRRARQRSSLDGSERRGSSVSACAHAVRHPLSVSPFSSRSGHCRPQHPHQEGSAPPCPGRGPLSRPQEKLPSRHMPCSNTASLRATATTASLSTSQSLTQNSTRSTRPTAAGLSVALAGRTRFSPRSPSIFSPLARIASLP